MGLIVCAPLLAASIHNPNNEPLNLPFEWYYQVIQPGTDIHVKPTTYGGHPALSVAFSLANSIHKHDRSKDKLPLNQKQMMTNFGQFPVVAVNTFIKRVSTLQNRGYPAIVPGKFVALSEQGLRRGGATAVIGYFRKFNCTKTHCSAVVFDSQARENGKAIQRLIKPVSFKVGFSTMYFFRQFPGYYVCGKKVQDSNMLREKLSMNYLFYRSDKQDSYCGFIPDNQVALAKKIVKSSHGEVTLGHSDTRNIHIMMPISEKYQHLLDGIGPMKAKIHVVDLFSADGKYLGAYNYAPRLVYGEGMTSNKPNTGVNFESYKNVVKSNSVATIDWVAKNNAKRFTLTFKASPMLDKYQINNRSTPKKDGAQLDNPNLGQATFEKFEKRFGQLNNRFYGPPTTMMLNFDQPSAHYHFFGVINGLKCNGLKCTAQFSQAMVWKGKNRIKQFSQPIHIKVATSEINFSKLVGGDYICGKNSAVFTTIKKKIALMHIFSSSRGYGDCGFIAAHDLALAKTLVKKYPNEASLREAPRTTVADFPLKKLAEAKKIEASVPGAKILEIGSDGYFWMKLPLGILPN